MIRFHSINSVALCSLNLQRVYICIYTCTITSASLLPPRPVSHAPLPPTPFIRGGYPPTSSGLPPPSSPSRGVTMPLPGQRYNVPESNATHPPSHIGTRPASYTPPFPTPSVHGRYPPTNPGLPPPSTPPRAVTMPLPYNIESNVARPPSHIGMPQEPQPVAGGRGRRAYILQCSPGYGLRLITDVNEKVMIEASLARSVHKPRPIVGSMRGRGRRHGAAPKGEWVSTWVTNVGGHT